MHSSQPVNGDLKKKTNKKNHNELDNTLTPYILIVVLFTHWCCTGWPLRPLTDNLLCACHSGRSHSCILRNVRTKKKLFYNVGKQRIDGSLHSLTSWRNLSAVADIDYCERKTTLLASVPHILHKRISGQMFLWHRVHLLCGGCENVKNQFLVVLSAWRHFICRGCGRKDRLTLATRSAVVPETREATLTVATACSWLTRAAVGENIAGGLLGSWPTFTSPTALAARETEVSLLGSHKSKKLS